MNRILTPSIAALVAAGLLHGCAYMDIGRGAYESTRSREATASPGSNRMTLPPYDAYQREREALKSGSSPAPAEPASAPKP